MSESGSLESGHFDDKSVERRSRARPSARRLRVRRSSINGGSSFCMNSKKSIRLIHSDTSALSASYQSGIHKESLESTII